MTKNYNTCALVFASSILIALAILLIVLLSFEIILFDNPEPIFITNSNLQQQFEDKTFPSLQVDDNTIHSIEERRSELTILSNPQKERRHALLDRLNRLRHSHIMGGEIVSDDHLFPHVASLQVSIDGDSYHLCGASLIDHRWLVTASHCCFDDNGGKLDPNSLSVVLGNSNLRKCSSRMNVKKNGCIRKKVNQLITHPLYDSNAVVNDIALIELKDSIEFSTSIRPIEIPNDNPDEGTDLTLAGWGSDPNDKKTTYLLKETNFPLLNENACGNIGLTISRNRGQICAGKDGSDACSGDSGSALFESKGSCDESEEFYCYSIAGLVSYGK